ncbi:helix-turn-helix transcriptional regulator [Citrifermentans bremense]|uniref:helix-turn-helix transcriptional regulator n=1 Tax=Citrifermentans bremense TaxID=60035 RepID=UPI00054E10AC|nr:AlpA family phage regulatory protein [Citrifermentans bremense]
MPKTKFLSAAIPEIGFLRLKQILGDPKADPPIPAIIPVSRTAWYEGMKTGKYPKPAKFGPRTSLWDVEEIRALLKH